MTKEQNKKMIEFYIEVQRRITLNRNNPKRYKVEIHDCYTTVKQDKSGV